MNRILSYPGAKWRIADKIVDLIPPHHSYLEPFFGSGAVLFSKKISNIETVNDLNGDVVNLFNCIQQDPGKLAYLVNTTPYSREIHEKSYELGENDPYERALQFLVQSWQGYGYRATGKKMGWKRDIQGRDRAYAVRNWCKVPETILDVAERLKQVQIENRPALDVINSFDSEKVFMYLDPPYLFDTRKSSQKQYNNEMSDQDHLELLQAIKCSKAKIMISGYDSELYNTELCYWNRITLRSNNNTGATVNEILWANYTLGGNQNGGSEQSRRIK